MPSRQVTALDDPLARCPVTFVVGRGPAVGLRAGRALRDGLAGSVHFVQLAAASDVGSFMQLKWVLDRNLHQSDLTAFVNETVNGRVQLARPSCDSSLKAAVSGLAVLAASPCGPRP